MFRVDDFFALATQEEDWHDQEERETVQRFQNLVGVLKQNLSQLRVYRVGSIEIDVYIVGVTPGGGLAGLSTETGGDLIATGMASYECLLIISLHSKHN